MGAVTMTIKSRLRRADVISPVAARHIITSDTSFTATPIIAHTVNLPEAGSYLIEFSDRFGAGTLAATRNITYTFSATNFVSCSLLGLVLRTGVQHALLNTQTANNHTYAMIIPSNAGIDLEVYGMLAVSAPAVVTLSAQLDAEAASIYAGSFIRARK